MEKTWSMIVRYTPRASGDLDNILTYLDERSSEGAKHVHYSIRRVVELIGEYPYAGRTTGEQNTRVLPAGRYPFLIYWSIEAGEVWILHLRHTSRQPWKNKG